MPSEQLKRWVDSAQVVIAADAGADRLHAVNFIPSTTLGDLDSISPAASVAQTRLIQNHDQDSTDCDKLLQFALEEGYRSITLAGVEGDLLDHVVGTLQSASRAKIEVRLALRRGIGFLLAGPFHRTFATTSGARFSVIPLEVCSGVCLRGTRWPLEGAVLDPMGLTSLSNIAEGTSVETEVASGRAFVFVETDGAPRWEEA
jgi:thiamine pyrophosphokinase